MEGGFIKLYILKEKAGTSKSKEIFTKISEISSTDIKYENLSFPERYFDKVIKYLKTDSDVIGFNVTMPYKVKITGYVEGDGDVEACGAVNCVKISASDRNLMGYNTDWYGIFNPINHYGVKRGICCIAGAGGAARSAVYAAIKLGFEEIHIFNRSVERAVGLKATFRSVVIHDISQLDGFLRRCETDVLINTTSMGMVPNYGECIPVTYESLGKVAFVFDAVYKPCRTKLLNMAQDAGCGIIYGIEMLYEQHAENIRIWDIPDSQNVLHALKKLKEEELLSIKEKAYQEDK